MPKQRDLAVRGGFLHREGNHFIFWPRAGKKKKPSAKEVKRVSPENFSTSSQNLASISRKEGIATTASGSPCSVIKQENLSSCVRPEPISVRFGQKRGQH